VKAIGYIRVSTEAQAGEDRYGPDVQRDAIRKYASAEGVDLARICEDLGVSGGLEHRPGLAAVYEALDAGDVGAVIVYRLDRLARDLRLQENILFDLRKKGVELISVSEPDLCSAEPERVLLRQVLGSFAEYERRVITLRLAAGRYRKADTGGYAGGEPPLGYATHGGALVVTGDADTVRRIFALRTEGATLAVIAATLIREGYPTKRGGTWAPATVKRILDNPKYHGAIRYGTAGAKGIHTPLVE